MKKSLNQKITVLKYAFPFTIPVLTGFLFMGISYGMLMNSFGFDFLFSTIVSLLVIGGSLQFVAIPILLSEFDPLATLIITLVVQARHLIYGISMLPIFKNFDKRKYYMIFAMCDETFSINYSVNIPDTINKNDFMFFISLLDHSYWVIGTLLGGILGKFIAFNIKGIEFVMTALFITIFINYWEREKKYFSQLIGLICTIICLIIFKKNNFLISSMIFIIGILVIFKNIFEKEEI